MWIGREFRRRVFPSIRQQFRIRTPTDPTISTSVSMQGAFQRQLYFPGSIERPAMGSVA